MWSAAVDVGEWLRGLGLGQYETVFREHAIDIDVLSDLKDGELAQIGVPLGDRKRLLKAIASRCKTEPSSSSRESAPPAEANLARDADPRAFCRRQGRGTASAHGYVLRPRRFDGARVAARRGGLAQPRQRLSRRSLSGGDRAWRHVLKKLGDGLMALFG
jgi:hypothetical protein